MRKKIQHERKEIKKFFCKTLSKNERKSINKARIYKRKTKHKCRDGGRRTQAMQDEQRQQRDN